MQIRLDDHLEKGFSVPRVVVPFGMLVIMAVLATAGCDSQPQSQSDQAAELTPQNTVSPDTNPPEKDSFPALEGSHELPDMSAGDDFEDITARSGIQHQYQSGRTAEQYTMIEGLGGGVALFDYDQDGDLDLLCASGGTISPTGEVQGLPCQLYQNEGDFQFTNVTEASGLNIPMDYHHGIAVADVNQDGYPDVFLSCYGRSRLFQNMAGKSFRDVTDQLGVELSGWHTASLFADFNQDGRPDLFVTGYLDWSMEDQPVCSDPVSGKRDVCLPSQFKSAPDRLLLNQGDFHFQDASQTYGIRNDGKGLGAISGDFDQDGRIDLYVANDVTSNFFYKGLVTGGFQEMGVSAGLSGNEYGSAEGSMGVTAADINHDGRMDLFVTNFELEDNSVYLNEGNDLFVHSTARLGLAGACRLLVGFGCLFSDLNADGWEDLVLLNGHLVYRHRNSDYQQKAFVFRNNQGRFQDVTSESGPWFQIPHSGRGLAVGDLNNDGAVDLVITEQDGPTSLLKNRNVPRNWLGLELKRKAGISDLTGTLVTFSLQNQKQTKQVLSGGSYLSHSDQRILFYPPAGSEGLDSAGIEVTWPDGSSDQFENLMWNTYQVLQQGTGNRSN